MVKRAGVDLVVIGELPLGGLLFDLTLVGSELELPLVLLDNAYSPVSARRFLHRHGNLFDGVALTGLSSFHPHRPPAFYCALPPLLAGSEAAAWPVLKELELEGTVLVTVMGYERKAEQLAIELLKARPDTRCSFLFLSRVPHETVWLCSSYPLSCGPAHVCCRPRPEEVLLSVLQHSRLAIGKCGFMQVSEALAAGTPFLAVYYPGCFFPSSLPRQARRFVHAGNGAVPDTAMLQAFDRLLQVTPEALRALHREHTKGLQKAGDYLESVQRRPRSDVTEGSARAGYRVPDVQAALQHKHRGEPIHVERVRHMRLDDVRFGHIDCVCVTYWLAGTRHFAALRGRRYWSLLFGPGLLRRALSRVPPESILWRSANKRCTLEEITS